jgi:hypothetical protein
MEIVKPSQMIPTKLVNSCSDNNGGSMPTQTKAPSVYHEQKETPKADEHKKHEQVILEAPNPLARRITSNDTDGNNQ